MRVSLDSFLVQPTDVSLVNVGLLGPKQPCTESQPRRSHPHPGARTHTRALNHKQQILLALDGDSLSPALMTAAMERCVPLTDRLDILLVNPPATPTRQLCGLLLKLEHSGIDYRITRTDGDLGEEVLNYIKRFLRITIVLVDKVSVLEQSIGTEMARFREMGYRFMPILEQ